jgi:alkylation response protein AidB-like acyl-CoA dehydrogenase
MIGGYGYLHDYDIERYVRDVRVHQILGKRSEFYVRYLKGVLEGFLCVM